MLSKVIFVLILCVCLYLSISGCSGQDASASVEAESTGATDVSQMQTTVPAEDQVSISDSGNCDIYSSDNSYMLRDYDYVGTGNVGYYYAFNYFIVSVMPGDVIEIKANTTGSADCSANFLVGGTELIKQCTYNGSEGIDRDNSIESESIYGANHYERNITISDPNQYILVFAVRDVNSGNDIMGHMKIVVHSPKTKDEHNGAFDKIVDKKIADLMNDSNNTTLQEEIFLLDLKNAQR